MSGSQPVGQKTVGGSESYLGRALVENKLATPTEVQACLAKLQELRKAGKQVRLVDVLIKSGIVTLSQLKRLANPSDDSMSSSLQQIPGFQLMRKVGSGAMASVYMAKQISLDRIVAIKVLPKRMSEDTEFVARFHKEGRAAAKLNHNNIVQAIDVGEYGGYHYFVMEYVDGYTVYDELAKLKRYGEKRALEIIIQIAGALQHAHEKGFIHRDVKPKNIMITKTGIAKLADMGLAREASDAQAAAEEKGRAYGTPYYISPEQVRGDPNVDFRADIYSLGATFYHMVTGRVPFEGTTPTDIMQKHLREPLIPPDHINKTLSTGVGEVIERAMAKDRERRYNSTTDMLLDLEAVLRGESPPQAHVGFDDDLLENLADGAVGNGTTDPQLAAQQRSMMNSSQTSYFVPMLIGLILEFVVIVVLLIALATR